jgi:protein-S-isoprenylcysteine O-methyltransferase Ste14
MTALENRIPPPFLTLVVAAAMGGAAWLSGPIALARIVHVGLVVGFLLLAGLFGAPAFLAFGRARTTIDPVHVDRASAMVTTGIYRITRNPMYVGLTCLLLSWAAWLAAPWGVLGPLVFVLFITRFQILPEERAMAAKFGAPYGDYKRRVRRWL